MRRQHGSGPAKEKGQQCFKNNSPQQPPVQRLAVALLHEQQVEQDLAQCINGSRLKGCRERGSVLEGQKKKELHPGWWDRHAESARRPRAGWYAGQVGRGAVQGDGRGLVARKRWAAALAVLWWCGGGSEAMGWWGCPSYFMEGCSNRAASIRRQMEALVGQKSVQMQGRDGFHAGAARTSKPPCVTWARWLSWGLPVLISTGAMTDSTSPPGPWPGTAPAFCAALRAQPCCCACCCGRQGCAGAGPAVSPFAIPS